jgi:hypothetical protein
VEEQESLPLTSPASLTFLVDLADIGNVSIEYRVA